MRFFKAIQYILARTNGPDVLNSAAHHILNEYIIPPLEEEAASGDPGAMELVELYSDYANGRNPRSRIFGVQAFKAIKATVASYNFSEDETDDFIMELISDMLTRKTWKSFRTIDEGPESFAKWFTGAARNIARSKSRNLANHRRHEVRIEPREDEEGDPIERIKDEGGNPMDALVEEEVQRDLGRYIEKKFGRKPVHMELFKRWMDGLTKYGTVLNLRQKIIKPLSKKLGVPEGTLYHDTGELKKAIAQFFAREYGLHVRANVTGSVKEVLAYTEYRRRMAAWVLPKNEVLRMLLLR